MNTEVLTDTQRLQLSNKVGTVGIVLNVILAVFKVSAGIIGKSSAMIADGVHTISDVVSTIGVVIGMRFSTKPADDTHPYGHERIESVVAKMLALVLLVTGFGIGINGIKIIISGEFSTPAPIALIAAAVSIVIKEWMYHYTMKAAIKANSPALKASAWDHRSDALSSIGTLAGIGGAILGLQILDPIASLIVSVLIIKVSLKIYAESFNQVVDRAAPAEVVTRIREIITNVPGVKKIDDVKTRIHGHVMFVDAEIAVDSDLTVNNGHVIAENVHQQIEKEVSGVKHCMVHVNPFQL